MNNNFKTLTKQNEIIELPSETDIRLNDMSVQIRKILLTLQQPMFTKDELKVFTDLYDYVKAYQRFLYSDVSSVIFEINKIHNDSKQSENMMYNIHRLLVFADELDVVTFQNYLKNKSKKKLTYNADCFKQTKNAINKLYDHVNLANNQYSIFQVTEEQFKKRVKQELENYKTEILSKQAIINFALNNGMRSDSIPTSPTKTHFTTPLGNSLGSVNELHTEAKNMIRQKHGVGTRHLQGI